VLLDFFWRTGKVILTIVGDSWANKFIAAATQQAVAQEPVVKPVRSGGGSSPFL
jgi:hypothetical protein